MATSDGGLPMRLSHGLSRGIRSFGVRGLVAAFSRADLSAHASSPRPVAVSESGGESPLSKLIVATGCTGSP